MDYLHILNVTLRQVGKDFPEVVSELRLCIESGSTGSEIIFSVGKYLRDLEFVNNKAYLIMQLEILKYIENCYANGIHIK